MQYCECEYACEYSRKLILKHVLTESLANINSKIDASQSIIKDVKMSCQKSTKVTVIAKVKHFHLKMILDKQYTVFYIIMCTKSPFYS